MSDRRFVFDTNTIVSAFLFENGKPGRALDLAEEQGRLFLSSETAQELSETLEYERFDDYVDQETRRELLLALLEEAELAEVTEQIQKSRDPDDDKFLELAVEIEAECIVSGDKDLLVLESIRSIPVLTADEFLQRAGGTRHNPALHLTVSVAALVRSLAVSADVLPIRKALKLYHGR